MSENLEQNTEPPSVPESPKQAAPFPVVGLGASAGGFQALRDFFTHMPAESGMAFVVIMHLSPTHESHAASLLQATTKMPVTQVIEAVNVEPNHVYVIPPTKNLEMNDGHITLTEPEPLHRGQQVTIDLFFRTLGETHKQHAVGIVLSGMGSDGTIGLKRIKEHNGLAFAQDPQESEQDSMPRHAISTGLVDFVLPVAQMPAKLIEIWRNTSCINLPPENEPPPSISQEDVDEAALRDIFMLLRSHTGHDFTHYKRATVLRRIERRLQVNQLRDITAYRDFMRVHPLEAQALLKDLLISVTNFFRDPAAFAEFEREVVPVLFHKKTTDDQVRVWVAGCATGEEPYSIAMLMLEYAERLASPPAIQVFATDIDEAAIATAREGLYAETIEEDVPPERLHRFFKKETGGYRIKKDVRECVLFAVHNLLKDPPFSKLDAIACRNLLIYLNSEAQEKIFDLFHFVLPPNGFLFLGNSESVEGAASLFATLDKKHRIYRAASGSRAVLRVPSLPVTAPFLRDSTPPREGVRAWCKISFGELHQKVLEQYAPPSVIINSDYDIVHVSEHAGRFLQFMGGEPSYNLLKVARPELRLELRTMLFQAAQTGKPYEARRVHIKRESGASYVNIVARPVSDGRTGPAHNYFLVLFDEIEGLKGESAAQSSGEIEPVMRLLEEELQSTREHHQGTIEQYDRQTQDLKASNEELQAMNEELRATTEELETGKEELQSVNEEISTINSELKNKLDELAIAHSDLQNLIRSTDLATIFVDRDLDIKFYTPRAEDIFNLIPSDVGRSLSDITHNLDYADLLQDAERVLGDMQKVEREVVSRAGVWYIARLIPYSIAEDRTDGVILTFVDFTKRKQVEEKLRESEEWLRAIFDASRDGILVEDNGIAVYVNNSYTRILGYDAPEELLGRHISELLPPDDAERMTEFGKARLRGEFRPSVYGFKGKRKDGSLIDLEAAVSVTRLGEKKYVITAMRDITQRLRAEEKIKDSEESYRRLVELSPDTMIVVSEGQIKYINPAGMKLLGASNAEQVINKPVLDVVHPDFHKSFEERIRETLTGKRLGLVEERFVRLDGQVIDVEETGVGVTYLGKPSTQAIVRDIGERLRSKEAQLHLQRRLSAAQEDERRRIAREMHDQFGQLLTALKMKLDKLHEDFSEQINLCEQIEALQAIAEELDDDVEHLAWEMRPTALDDLGLRAALSSYVQNWSTHFGVPVQLHASGMDQDRLSSEIETALFRVAQEALNNVAKHAQATSVAVVLERRSDNVSLIIEDDGLGFDWEQVFSTDDKGLGLLGMRERAALVGGTIEIESQPEAGTTVVVRIAAPQDGSCKVK